MSEKKDKAKHTGAMSDDAIERDVFRALINVGHIIPESESEVEAAEKRLEQRATPLPEKLRDPETILSKLKSSRGQKPAKVVPLPNSLFTETAAELARAARKGGDIPSEVEERMRKNRERLRGQSDGDSEPK